MYNTGGIEGWHVIREETVVTTGTAEPDMAENGNRGEAAVLTVRNDRMYFSISEHKASSYEAKVNCEIPHP